MREYGKQREQETERRRLQAFRADLPEVSAWEPFGEKRLVVGLVLQGKRLRIGRYIYLVRAGYVPAPHRAGREAVALCILKTVYTFNASPSYATCAPNCAQIFSVSACGLCSDGAKCER